MDESPPPKASAKISDLLAEIVGIARSAGREIMAHYGTDCPVATKADDSPLTAADQAAHVRICGALQTLTPEIPVVSEESTAMELEGHPHDRELWLVDPLDGTKEFLKRTGQFTVNIGLVREKRPVMGVVHAPGMQVSYFAEAGGGAWKQTGDAPPVPIRTVRANPANLRVVASKDHAGPRVAAMLTKISGANLVSLGSALKFCLVAEGQADLYPRFVGTMEWDTAAAQCVVETAGGTITDMAGHPLAYQKDEWRNPSIITSGDRSFCWSSCL